MSGWCNSERHSDLYDSSYVVIMMLGNWSEQLFKIDDNIATYCIYITNIRHTSTEGHDARRRGTKRTATTSTLRIANNLLC